MGNDAFATALASFATDDDRARATRARQSKSGPDEVNEQRGEIEHAQQRRGGIGECNHWKFKAPALQDGNSHPDR